MDRRDTLKSLLISGLGGSLVLSGCQPGADEKIVTKEPALPAYGRTEKEKVRDAKLLLSPSYFNEHEIATIAILCDLILPASETAGSATETGVPDFIDFIVKDMPHHQTPIRGGVMWLDNRSHKLFEKNFRSCDTSQQKQLLDEIAWPDDASPETEPGVKFFSLMRNLVLTGYYTTRMGIEDLGYKGNAPNVWDGVPEEVLEKHGLAYDPEWLAKCVDQDKRTDIAQWDEDGNLIT